MLLAWQEARPTEGGNLSQVRGLGRSGPPLKARSSRSKFHAGRSVLVSRKAGRATATGKHSVDIVLELADLGLTRFGFKRRVTWPSFKEAAMRWKCMQS